MVWWRKVNLLADRKPWKKGVPRCPGGDEMMRPEVLLGGQSWGKLQVLTDEWGASGGLSLPRPATACALEGSMLTQPVSTNFNVNDAVGSSAGAFEVFKGLSALILTCEALDHVTNSTVCSMIHPSSQLEVL